MQKTAIYFRIGEAARLLGVSVSSLRNWQQMGLLAPVRSQGHYRLYTREVLKRLRHIKYLSKVKHVNSAGIAAMLQQQSGECSPACERRNKQETIGQRLLQLRRQLRFSLTEVAQKPGLSLSFLSALEHGHANPSIATLQKLAHLHRTNVLSFFGEDESTRRLVRRSERKVLKPG